MPLRLLIIHHAVAEDAETFALFGEEDDSRRPLTQEGREGILQAAQGLRRQVPDIDLLGTSPLLRATETAEILAAVYDGRLEPVQVPELSPSSSPIATLRWLRSQPGLKTIALVGHEPILSGLTGWLLIGNEKQVLALEEGGACLMEFPNGLVAGGARLLWALTPAQLCALSHESAASP